MDYGITESRTYGILVSTSLKIFFNYGLWDYRFATSTSLKNFFNHGPLDLWDYRIKDLWHPGIYKSKNFFSTMDGPLVDGTMGHRTYKIMESLQL